jgi:adenine-specific DNA-methyltransferase
MGILKMSKPERLELTVGEDLKLRNAELLRLFPESRTEGGRIDFDRLKLVIGEAIDVGKERYSINWPGKARCFDYIQEPSNGTLSPAPDESVDFNRSQNILIEGDNLEVLKLMQKSYMGKVKMIYIDPPYNTGNDFIYPDDFGETLETYLKFTGQIDAEGKRFSTNTEAHGRFHSKWLNMMYPRLFLARNLLTDEGVMFISIDDHEVHTLRRICDEIFGEENFVCTFIWEKRYSPPPDTKEVGYVHENILLYRKSSEYKMGLLPLTDDQQARYKNPDKDPRGPWKPMDYTCRYTRKERPNLYYRITNPNTRKSVLPKETRVWAFSKEVNEKNVEEKRIWWGVDGKARVPALKNFLSDIRQGMMPTTLLKQESVGNTDEATKELRNVIPELKFTPKPIRLIKHLAAIANLSPTDLVLDFFAGSGTTALAVLALNAEESSERRFILVQLPEPTGLDDFRYVTDITKERVRRVIAPKKKDKQATGSQSKGAGFRLFKLTDSNFRPWKGKLDDQNSIGNQLELHVNHIKKGRSDEDILYELLLKSGFPLSALVEAKTIAGKMAYSVANGALIICLARTLTVDLIRGIAELKPERVIYLDEGFAGHDQLKVNAIQIMKSKGVVSFRTV